MQGNAEQLIGKLQERSIHKFLRRPADHAASKRSVHAKQYTVVSDRKAHSGQTRAPHSWHCHTAFLDRAPHGQSPSGPGTNNTTGRDGVPIYGSRPVRTPRRPAWRLRAPRERMPTTGSVSSPTDPPAMTDDVQATPAMSNSQRPTHRRGPTYRDKTLAVMPPNVAAPALSNARAIPA